MKRREFQHDGLTFSYLDAEGSGEPILALHGYFMEAAAFAPLSIALAPEWRLLALDQRGHGQSDHAPTYSRSDCVEDILAFDQALGLGRSVLVGHSLGGVNAYQFAARYPELVRALVIEDAGVEVSDDMTFTLRWGGVFESRSELLDHLGPHFRPYLEESIRRVAGGWRLAFDPNDVMALSFFLNGNHWQDWLATSCPALLIHARENATISLSQLAEMAHRRPNTTLVTLDGGEVAHIDLPRQFVRVVKAFLRDVSPS